MLASGPYLPFISALRFFTWPHTAVQPDCDRRSGHLWVPDWPICCWLPSQCLCSWSQPTCTTEQWKLVDRNCTTPCSWFLICQHTISDILYGVERCLEQNQMPAEWIWDVKERPLWHRLAFGRNLWCWLKKCMDVHFSAGHRTDTGYRIWDTGPDVKVGGWLVEGKTNQFWTLAETTSKWSSFFDNCKKAGHWSQVLIYFQNGTE